jgi:hypothetical protein
MSTPFVDFPAGTHLRCVLRASGDALSSILCGSVHDSIAIAREWNRRAYAGTPVVPDERLVGVACLAFAPVEVLQSDAFQVWFAALSDCDAFDVFTEVVCVFAREGDAIDAAEARMRVLKPRLCTSDVMTRFFAVALVQHIQPLACTLVQRLLTMPPAAMPLALDILAAVCVAAPNGPSPMYLLVGAALLTLHPLDTVAYRVMLERGAEMARGVAQRCVPGPKWNRVDTWREFVDTLANAEAACTAATRDAFRAFATALLEVAASRVTAPLVPDALCADDDTRPTKWLKTTAKRAIFDAAVAVLLRRAETPVPLDRAEDLDTYGCGRRVWSAGLVALSTCSDLMRMFSAMVPILLALKRNPHADAFALADLLARMTASGRRCLRAYDIEGRPLGVTAMFVMLCAKYEVTALRDAGIINAFDWATVHDLLRMSTTRSFNAWVDADMCDEFMRVVRAAAAEAAASSASATGPTLSTHGLLGPFTDDFVHTHPSDSLGAAIAFAREREATALLEFLRTYECADLRTGAFGSPIVRDLLACGLGVRRHDDALKIARLFKLALRFAGPPDQRAHAHIRERLTTVCTRDDVVDARHVSLLVAAAQWTTTTSTCLVATSTDAAHTRYFVDLARRRRAWLCLRETALLPPGQGGAGPAEYVRRSRSRQAYRARNAERDAWHAAALVQRDWAVSVALRAGLEPPPAFTLAPPAAYRDVPRLPAEFQAQRDALRMVVRRTRARRLPIEVEVDIMARVMDIDDRSERRDLELIMRDHAGPACDAATGRVLMPPLKRASDTDDAPSAKRVHRIVDTA